MDGLKFTVSFEEVSISVVQDLFEGLLASDHIITPIEIRLSQRTLAQDANEEILHCSLRRVTGAPTSGSGGTTPTARQHQSHYPSTGVTWEANNTTQLTSGTNVVLLPFDWNLRQAELILPIPEGRYWFSPSQRILLELETAPSGAMTSSGSITYVEIGG